MEKPKRETGYFALWLNWLVSTGMVNIAVFLAPWVTGMWMALLCFSLALCLIVYMRYMRVHHTAVCNLIPWVEMRTLGLAALIMLVISVFFSRGYADMIYGEDLVNHNRPFITILILAPVTLMLTLWVLWRGERNVFCTYCVMKNGMGVERGAVGKLFAEERPVQIKLLILLTLSISILTWTYYFLHYVNVNINSADIYFLTVLPLFLWICTVIYLAIRYFSLYGYYYHTQEIGAIYNVSSTKFRFLVFHDDHIFLSRDLNNDLPGHDRLDTPASITLKHTDHPKEGFAQKVFADLSGLSPEEFRIRPMYVSRSDSGKTNIFHYIVMSELAERDHRLGKMEGTWYTLSQLQHLLSRHDLDPLLAAEINRLYKVTMAWKTYDAQGRRLYRIKNYKPMFRLHGIMDWDVDFNDRHWLEVANNNEDQFLFRLRKLWNSWIARLH